MAIGESMMVGFISALIFFVINGLIIWLTAAKILNFHDQSTKTAFTVAGIAAVVGFIFSLIPSFMSSQTGIIAANIMIFIVNALVLIFLVRKYYDVDWGHAILTWVLVLVADIIIGFLVGMIIGFAIIGTGLAI